MNALLAVAAPSGVVLDAPDWLLASLTAAFCALLAYRTLVHYRYNEAINQSATGHANVAFYKTPLLWISLLALLQMIGNTYWVGASTLAFAIIITGILDYILRHQRR